MNNKKIYIELMNALEISINSLNKFEDALGVMIDCDLTKFIDKADTISACILGLENPCDAYYEYFWNMVNNHKCTIEENGQEIVIFSWDEFYDYWINFKEEENE